MTEGAIITQPKMDVGGAVPGVILAGGLSTRMGGGDKALLELAGRSILARVIARLAPQVGALALNANGDPERFAGFGLPVIPDTVPGHPGPLAGLLAALDWAAGIGAAQVITAAADTPFLPMDLAARLAAAGGARRAPVLAATASGLHPTFGLWPVGLRDALAVDLAAGARRIGRWAQAQGARQVIFDEIPLDPFFNINTPDDLARAKGQLAKEAR